ncbi:MAG: response regulator [Syntrophobacteraceae bacterium]|jgi:DNA-binding response OmpR family regulator
MKRIFTILVADKNKNVRDFLLRELAAEGYEVVVARDGGRILAEIDREDGLDLLVFDLEMPDTDSTKIFEKAQNRQPPLPVIIHTFLTEESERDSSLDKGEIYIEKSGNIDHLKAAIADMLNRFYPDQPTRPDSWSPSGNTA